VLRKISRVSFDKSAKIVPSFEHLIRTLRTMPSSLKVTLKLMSCQLLNIPIIEAINHCDLLFAHFFNTTSQCSHTVDIGGFIDSISEPSNRKEILEVYVFQVVKQVLLFLGLTLNILTATYRTLSVSRPEALFT
jgi:hypothetical protein